MTMTIDAYVNRVLDALPAGTPRRGQIAVELRGHIGERLASGQALDTALAQLGDPLALAESYASAVPLVAGAFGARAMARIVDLGIVAAVMAPIGVAIWLVVPPERLPFVLLPYCVLGGLAVVAYPMFAEARFGSTIGKHLFGLRVVRESGTRISGGQAIVRNLPWVLEVFWIDAVFALFTEKSQRAFELLSKTRVVRAGADQR